MTRNMIVQQLAMLYMKKSDMAKMTPKQVVRKYHQVVKQMQDEDKQLHKSTKKSASHQVGFH
ncbi:hypothetical protein [Acetilactobacillus jinshanensis]|uniref:Uncharacterized protein n=1 Tax=Acetilactobacillus jinshanensis TaxID=1720083 RepID=A0A4P6ZK04_9LACO|nr:hypothetical protein [Acetilactobacillus jinshanensis]QBP18091.1 hypothetical protein ELX58_02800 [Acetilactobacillus jinshanensis]URL60954.1 hypothetical protein HGK75_02840 [uncultured bacterium]